MHLDADSQFSSEVRNLELVRIIRIAGIRPAESLGHQIDATVLSGFGSVGQRRTLGLDLVERERLSHAAFRLCCFGWIAGGQTSGAVKLADLMGQRLADRLGLRHVRAELADAGVCSAAIGQTDSVTGTGHRFLHLIGAHAKEGRGREGAALQFLKQPRVNVTDPLLPLSERRALRVITYACAVVCRQAHQRTPAVVVRGRFVDRCHYPLAGIVLLEIDPLRERVGNVPAEPATVLRCAQDHGLLHTALPIAPPDHVVRIDVAENATLAGRCLFGCVGVGERVAGVYEYVGQPVHLCRAGSVAHELGQARARAGRVCD